MAKNEENTSKSRVVYNFGENQLDLEEYIYNLGINVKGYLDHQDWSEGQKDEFRKSFDNYINALKEQLSNNTNRLSADNFGQIKDNNSKLSSQDDDGIDDDNSEYYYNKGGERITTSDYNKLNNKEKEKWKTFSANRHVASYFDRIGRDLVEYYNNKKKNAESENPSINKFDLNKNGFISYYSNIMFPHGSPELSVILNLDKFDSNIGKRPRTGRITHLKDYLTKYINYIQGLDYDFSESPYTSKENYINILNNLYKGLEDNSWDDSDVLLANQAGISPKFYNAFFTEEENPDLTEQQKTEQQEQSESEIRRKAWEAEAKTWQDKHREYVRSRGTNYITDLNPHSIYVGEDYLVDGKFNLTNWINSFAEGNDEYSNIINDQQRIASNTNIIDYIKKVLQNPYYNPEINRALQLLIGMGYAKKLENGTYYIERDSDASTGSALIYDPTSYKLYETYIGSVKPVWDNIKNKFIRDNYSDDWYAQYNKQGGLIQKFQFGGSYQGLQQQVSNQLQKELEDRAKKSDNTIEQQKINERRVGSIGNEASPSALSPDSGIGIADAVELGTIGADILSMLTGVIPGLGTIPSAILGLGSTLGTLGVDLSRDGVQFGDFTNFATNLGMDLLGVIPWAGQGSKWAKITKNVAKWVPRLLAAYSTNEALENRENIMGSLNKLMDTPKEMTVGDWRNVAQGIGAVTGVVGAVGRKVKKEVKYNDSKVKDTVAIDVIDNNGNKKTIAFEGDDAKAIIQAKNSGNIDAIKDVTVKKYEDLKGWDLATSQGLKFQWIRKDGSWRSPFGSKEIPPEVYGVYNGRNRQYTKTKWYQNSSRPSKTYDENFDITTSKVDEAVQKRRNDIVETMKQASKKEETIKSRAEKYLQEQNKKITEYETKLGGRKSSDIETKVIDIETQRADANFQKRIEEYNKNIKARDKIQKKLNEDDRSSNPMEDSDRQKLENQLSKLNDKINKDKIYIDDANLQNLKNTVTQLKDIENSLKDHVRRRDKITNFMQRWNTDPNNPTFISKEYNDFINTHKTNDGKISWDNPYGRENTEMTIREFNEILKNSGVKFKMGGTLNMKKVRSFKNSGTITNTSSNGVDWYKDMFKHRSMQDWLDTYNVDNYEDFNNLQKSWAINKQATGYSINNPRASYNQGVFDRQGKWNETGTNAAIEDAFKAGKIRRPINAISGDNASKGYQDGYFGIQEFLRHGGTEDSWKGYENELKKFQEEVQKKGLTYTLDNNTKMYLFAPISDTSNNVQKNNNVQELVTSEDIPQEDNTNATITELVIELLKDKEDDNKNNKLNSIDFNSILRNPTLTYGLNRLFLGNAVNDKLTNMAIESEIPMLQDPFERHRTQISDLNAEIRGQQSAAQLQNLSSRPLTSDANQQVATQLEATLKGQDFINQGKKASDEIRRISAEQAWQQEKENAKNRHDIAMQNRLANIQTQSNKAKHKMAKISKDYTNFDTFSKQLEYEAKEKLEKNKKYEEAFVTKDIQDYVTNNLENLDKTLDKEAIRIYQQVKSGVISPSELQKDSTKWDLFVKASRSAQQLESDLVREWKGIPKSRWATARIMSEEQQNKLKTKIQEILKENSNLPEKSESREGSEVPGSKNGSKIEVANIRAKTERAKRFQNQIEKAIDRNEKILNRLSKSLYGYVKASIVK